MHVLLTIIMMLCINCQYILCGQFVANILDYKNIGIIEDPTESEHSKLPKNYKTSKGIKIPDQSRFKDALRDFENYNLSTSSQFNPEQLKNMFETLRDQYGIKPHQIYIVDLREEPHLYVNNMSVSLGVLDTPHDSQKFQYFIGFSPNIILNIEEYYKQLLLKGGVHTLYVPIDKGACTPEGRYKT
ncbi:MAG: hypothetical protein Q8K36_00505, partial [Alphaproteobacteria bacterium]|nr:hypothetical protein [Alphaproteobacteria bacterium]